MVDKARQLSGLDEPRVGKIFERGCFGVEKGWVSKKE
jgi:hypothetical protein